MSLEELLQRASIWRAGKLPAIAGLVSGFPALDAILPGGGWPLSGLTEILAAMPGIGALRLVLPALARLSRAGRWIIWVTPPYVPYSPALYEYGLDLSRVLVIDWPDNSVVGKTEAAWAYEQALRFVDCGAALLWQDEGTNLRLRRLQLAAEAGATWGIVFRPERCAAQPSPAPLRLVLEPAQDAANRRAGRVAPLRVTVRKGRGAVGGRHCLLDL